MISLVFGRRERGKTTLAYHEALKKETRLIIDPRAQFNTTSDKLPDETGVYDLLDTRFEIVVQPENDPKAVFDAVTSETRAWLKDNPGAQFALLLDEARIFDTANVDYSDFDAILRMTPREEVDVIITAHRPSDVSVDIRAIADFWLIFQITQEHDLKVIAERCGSKVAEIAVTLPEHSVIVWNDAKGTYSVHHDSEKWRHNIKAFPRNVREEGERAIWQPTA